MKHILQRLSLNYTLRFPYFEKSLSEISCVTIVLATYNGIASSDNYWRTQLWRSTFRNITYFISGNVLVSISLCWWSRQVKIYWACCVIVWVGNFLHIILRTRINMVNNSINISDSFPNLFIHRFLGIYYIKSVLIILTW